MFIAALYTKARTEKQPKCPLIEEWIKKTEYMYTMEYGSAKKKEEIIPLTVTWVDIEMVILRKTNIMCYHLYVGSKKKWYR